MNTRSLYSLADLLLDGPSPAERLRGFYQAVNTLLSELDLSMFLGQILGPQRGREAYQGVSGYLHVGFLAPAYAQLSQLSLAATAANFGAEQSSMVSEVMARELEQKAGKPIPTRIFKAYALAQDGRKNGVEAFLPEAEPAVLNRWVAQRIGTHLGIGLKHRKLVWQALEFCQEAGLRTPNFLEGEPAVNRAEDILVIYADGTWNGEPLRLEFYHATSERAFTL